MIVSADPIPGLLKSQKAIPLNDFDQYLSELADRVRSYYG